MLKELVDELTRMKAQEPSDNKERYLILFGRSMACALTTYFDEEEANQFLNGLHDLHRCQLFGHQAVYISRLPTFTVLKVSELSAILQASLLH